MDDFIINGRAVEGMIMTSMVMQMMIMMKTTEMLGETGARLLEEILQSAAVERQGNDGACKGWREEIPQVGSVERP